MTASISPNLPDWIRQHVELYLSDPDKAHYWDSSMGGGKGMLPTLLLVCTGARSGETRMLPLIYKKVGDVYVIIASKGGAPEHPAWYRNLVVNPDCEIRVGKEVFDATARTASGGERERLWAELAEIYPPYNDYQVRAGDREIPVVVLEVK